MIFNIFRRLAHKHSPEVGAETAIRILHSGGKNEKGVKIYFTPDEYGKLKQT